ncbi:MAG: glycogen debranching enzyme N-terminal domain-containing protein [Elusimicrobiota bacterium]|nr:MAG: glycogen debranching enzyme N-terminal domain-containing protein [Elusimicrobiota bacterium]
MSAEAIDRQLEREWLVTNGLGGYAAGTIAGVCTRRFHGHLVASLPAPLGRVMMLNHVAEELRLADGRVVRLGGGDEIEAGRVEAGGAAHLAGFRLDGGLPVWRWELEGIVLEKSLVLPHLQNTVFMRYRLLAAPAPARLHIRPSVHFREHEGRVASPLVDVYSIRSVGPRHEIRGRPDAPPLKLLAFGRAAAFLLDGGSRREIFYRVEHDRGYDAAGALWSPGYLRADLVPGEEAGLGASTEPWETFAAMGPGDAFAVEEARRASLLRAAPASLREGRAAALVHAADQFVMTPNTRVLDAARARAAGDDIRSVIAGYHWFTDWGRDTMISLEGLLLHTGRHAEAACILRMFARHMKDGLIPNLFPEGHQEGLYHAADATLWLFHALGRYADATGDWATVAELVPGLEDSVARQLAGTRFGIRVDPADGLLAQGEDGYQLTWMDAKVAGWVVTPRRGKTVEINALWHNALRLLEGWVSRLRGPAAALRYGELAAATHASFNARFWNESAGCLFDLVDGDPAEASLVRPNQLLAISLTHPVLDPARWPRVLETVERDLLTPVGLRSLAPGSPNYRARYDGDLRSRDAAYHQGTVWGWLIGPYVDARLKVRPGDRAGARACLDGLLDHLDDACVGSISEIFDAEAPYRPRGCVAQAWSVAEVLRAWRLTEPDGNS